MAHYVTVAGQKAVEKAPGLASGRVGKQVTKTPTKEVLAVKGKSNLYLLMLILYWCAYAQLIFNSISLLQSDNVSEETANQVSYVVTLVKLYFYSYYAFGMEIFVFNNRKRLSCCEWLCCTTCYAIQSFCCCYGWRLVCCAYDAQRELMHEYDPSLKVYNQFKWLFCILGLIDSCVGVWAAIDNTDGSVYSIIGAIISLICAILAVRNQWISRYGKTSHVHDDTLARERDTSALLDDTSAGHTGHTGDHVAANTKDISDKVDNSNSNNPGKDFVL